MATKARLHRFWRGMIALAVGMVLIVLIGDDWIPGYGKILELVRHPIDVLSSWVHIPSLLVWIDLMWVAPSMLLTLVTWVLLSRLQAGMQADGETHCRKCNHILRGLSEPRCPECGEAI
jgi:hypothetical protein